MDILWYGLIAVGIIGAVVVAVRVLRGKGGDIAPVGAKSAEPVIAPVATPPSPAPAPAPVREFIPGPTLTRRDDALYAVITGAVAQTLAAEGINPEGGFAIKSVTPLNGPDAKKLTQRDGALYAIITAAIAQTLANEGINPENGFTIQSVTAV